MATALSCLFLSGAASLFYEVCWIRKAGLFFGSTTFALATVLAVFFPRTGRGQCLGWSPVDVTATSVADLWDRRTGHRGVGPGEQHATGRSRRRLRNALSLGRRLSALDRAGALGLGGSRDSRAHGFDGTTVPLLAKAIIRRHRSLGFAAGGLYGINALGAATGAALAGFVTLPILGLAATIYLGQVSMSCVASPCCWSVGKRTLRRLPSSPTEKTRRQTREECCRSLSCYPCFF